jgi:hypothetical protein
MAKIILDLCGGTGAWSRPYAEAGYDVRLVTLPDDVRLYVPPKNVHGILAAPPCTHFCSSGARWFKQKGDTALLDGLSVVDACLRIIWLSRPTFWALENPVGRLMRFIGKPRMYFQPYEYGDPYTKKTCLWGDFNPPAPHPVECKPEHREYSPGHNSPIRRFPSKMHLLPPTKDRATLRSITPPGFARAFFESNP